MKIAAHGGRHDKDPRTTDDSTSSTLGSMTFHPAAPATADHCARTSLRANLVPSILHLITYTKPACQRDSLDQADVPGPTRPGRGLALSLEPIVVRPFAISARTRLWFPHSTRQFTLRRPIMVADIIMTVIMLTCAHRRILVDRHRCRAQSCRGSRFAPGLRRHGGGQRESSHRAPSAPDDWLRK